jgi:hypothetical protein
MQSNASAADFCGRDRHHLAIPPFLTHGNQTRGVEIHRLAGVLANQLADTEVVSTQIPGTDLEAIGHRRHDRPRIAEKMCRLSTLRFCTFPRELSSLQRPSHVGGGPNVLEGLSGVNEPPMIIRMTTTGRFQQRYDHRLRDLVHATGDVTIATNLGVPRSTARGWLRKATRVAVSTDVMNLKTMKLQQEILELRRRVKKLTALLRLALAPLRSSRFTLTHQRLPDGRNKIRILQAVDRARHFVPLRVLLRFLRLSPSRFHAWRWLEHACALDDQSSCPHTSSHRLAPREVQAIKDMVTAADYRHGPTGTLAVLAQRLGKVLASPSTWYHLVREHGWRRPRLRVHPAKPKVGLRTTRANEMWHIDTSVIRLLDGTRACLHAVIETSLDGSWRGGPLRRLRQ